MKDPIGIKTWEKTKVQFLVRHKSGRYYARLFLNGKEIWKSLKTAHLSVAQARLADILKEHRKNKGREVDPSNAKMTFVQAAALHEKQLAQEGSIKRRTRKYYQEVLASLLKSWPDFAETELRRITPSAFKEWATRYNGTLSLLRRILDLAVEIAVIYSNPAANLERRAQKAKHLELPTRAQFAEFVEEMRTAQTRDSKNCTVLAQGLAFTGCRISEANQIEWRDLAFAAGEILVKGDPEEGTRNGEIRRIPMIPQARALFEKMRQERSDEPPSTKVFLVNECQHSMDSAAKKIGMTRITHHDLRHFFATVAWHANGTSERRSNFSRRTTASTNTSACPTRTTCGRCSPGRNPTRGRRSRSSKAMPC